MIENLAAAFLLSTAVLLGVTVFLADKGKHRWCDIFFCATALCGILSSVSIVVLMSGGSV